MKAAPERGREVRMQQMVIERNTRSRRRKTRRFAAVGLGYVSEGDFRQKSPFDEVRPWWLACGGPATTLEPFVANLRGGFKARHGGNTLRIPKSARFGWWWVTLPAGQVAVAYDPGLLCLSPPVPETEDVRFLLMPSERWLAGPRAAGLSDRRAIASLFAAYLDRRVRLPILRDGGFHEALFEAALERGLLQTPLTTSYVGDRLAPLGLHGPWWCRASHSDVEAFLIERTAAWRQEVVDHGETRFQTNRGLLPHAVEAGEQLCFAFAG